jgi:regulator of sigma E protease
MPEVIISGFKVVLGVLFVLGVAINIHEFGHFIVARILGMRVEAFSFFGIGPRIWGFKRGNTDYRISAIPLGAYVKLYGDEATSSLEGGSSEGEQVPKEELYELRPRWQKFLVMLGGPFMNIVLALAIPFGMAMYLGLPAVPAPVIDFVRPESAAQIAGLKAGDRVVQFDGIKDPSWSRIRDDAMLLAGKKTAITVEREGDRVDLSIVPDKRVIEGNTIGDLGFIPDAGVENIVVADIMKDMPAATSGLKLGDRITSVNGKVVKNGNAMKTAVAEAKDEPIELSVTRGEENLKIKTSAVKKGTDYLIGISFSPAATKFEPVGIGGAANYAVAENWRILRLTGKAFGQMFSGERSVKDGGIAGPIGIVEQIAKVTLSFGFVALLSMLMIISLNLGIFNLLPIPLLDGGQIMVLGIEAVLALFGLKLSMAIKESIQLVGLGFILLLMVVVFYFDISRLFG